MKKTMFFVISALVLFSAQSSASLLGSITHDYGIGQYDPGGNDVLTTDAVVVSDQSSGRFNDLFDFSGIAGTVTMLELILNFSDAGPTCSGFLCLGSGSELWTARLQGSNPGGTSDDLFPWLVDASSPQSIYLDFTSDVGGANVWSHSIGQGALGLWFSESTAGSDGFGLSSGTLNVFGESVVASVPLPGTVSLMGFGLAAFGFMTRRRKVNTLTA
jgi:hypothetical protein